MPTGAELFVDALEQLGLTDIFTLVGDHLNEALLEAARRDFRIIDFRHESGVTHAADVWARLHRRPALAMVTGGPGHTNALTGIATANLAASPLVVVSGSRATTAAQRQAFQDLDQLASVRPLVKWAAEVPAASQIPFYLGRAWAEATAGRMGAVHLTIPVDVFRAQAPGPAVVPMFTPAPPRPDPRDIDRALALLEAAERPVVIAGSGIWWAHAEDELRQFIERTSLPLYTITMARSLVPDDHPLVMGYPDPAMCRTVIEAFREADLFVILGKRLDFRLALGGARLFPAGAKFIQVDIHPQELGMNRPLEVGICADVKATLRALLAGLGSSAWPPTGWLDRLRGVRQQWRDFLAGLAQDRGSPIHPVAFFAELKQALPPGILYSWDGANFPHWGRASLPALIPGGWVRLGPLGTIGAGFPNALALQLANPGKPVALVTGDGSLGFYLIEMDTAVRLGLPLVIIVGNDGCWGLERDLQLAEAGRTVACDLRPTRYDLVMKGFGGDGETIETLEQVRPAVERAFASGKPYVLNVLIRGIPSPFVEWQIAGKK